VRRIDLHLALGGDFVAGSPDDTTQAASAGGAQ
jgi:hypothetical protein